MWTDQQQNVILDYCLKRTSRNAFLKKLPFDVHEVTDEVRYQLTAALENKNRDLVEIAFLAADIFDMPAADYIDLQLLLVTEDWHHSHEYIIGSLQKSGNASAVPFIKRAIELKPCLEYLAYDDYGSYYKKCLWALQAIATAEAIAVIQDCTGSQDPALREEALYRLSRINVSS
jgi:hypothetical protein